MEKEINTFITIIRESKGWEKKELAERIGVTGATMTRIESGESRNIKTINLALKALGVDWRDFEVWKTSKSQLLSIDQEKEFTEWCNSNGGYNPQRFIALAIFILQNLSHEQRIVFLKKMEAVNVTGDHTSSETSKPSDEDLGERILRDTQATIESLRKDKKPRKMG